MTLCRIHSLTVLKCNCSEQLVRYVNDPISMILLHTSYMVLMFLHFSLFSSFSSTNSEVLPCFGFRRTTACHYRGATAAWPAFPIQM